MKESVRFNGNKTAWAKAALILVAILWGSSLVVAKSSIDHISPSMLIAMRFTIACALLSAVFFRKLKGIAHEDVISGAKIGALDEPSLGLAPIIINEVFNKITQINKEIGQTILLVEQNAYLALEVSHRAYVMKTGQIIREGASGELLHDPSIQEDYLGAK